LPPWRWGLITQAAQAERYLAEQRCDLVALAREIDVGPPIGRSMPQQQLGGVDPLDLAPKSYAWWLRRRDETRKLYPTGKEAAE